MDNSLLHTHTHVHVHGVSNPIFQSALIDVDLLNRVMSSSISKQLTGVYTYVCVHVCVRRRVNPSPATPQHQCDGAVTELKIIWGWGAPCCSVPSGAHPL